jgi:2,3-bisphosphoglycerate-independent phosphoglycerate mutase
MSSCLLDVFTSSHLNIGAGRIVWQDIVRIDESIRKKKFATTGNVKKSFERAKDSNGRLHLLGLVSLSRREESF